MMRNNNSQKGFSLIELVLGIVIISVALVSSMVTLKNLTAKSVELEILNRSTNYANNIMEMIISKRFDEVTSSAWSGTLGPEEGSIAQYDDIDDFNGHVWTTGHLPGYSGVSKIEYVSQNNWLTATNNVSNYKLVTVTVSHSELTNPVVIKSLVTAGKISAAGGGNQGGGGQGGGDGDDHGDNGDDHGDNGDDHGDNGDDHGDGDDH